MARTDPQVSVRLPHDAKAFVEAQAREDASSQNSVIVRAIRAAMKAKGPASAPTLPSHGSNSSGQEEDHEQP